eukprot:scaffold3.g6583.t1
MEETSRTTLPPLGQGNGDMRQDVKQRRLPPHYAWADVAVRRSASAATPAAGPHGGRRGEPAALDWDASLQDAALAASQRQLAALRDEVARQRGQLRECSAAPADLLRAKAFRAELASRDAALQALARKVAVVEKAKEAAERRLRADAAAGQREHEGLQQQVAALQAAVNDKEREARLALLHVRTLYQRLEPLEAAVAGLAPRAAPPSPPPPDPQRVHVMLCLVREEVGPSPAVVAEEAARLAQELAREIVARQEEEEQRRHSAATAIQAAARGFAARRRLARLRRAAAVIQACARGMLARHRLRGQGDQGQQQQPAALSSAERMVKRRKVAEALHAQRTALAKQQHNRAKARPRQPSMSTQQPRGGNTSPEAALRMLARKSQLGATGLRASAFGTLPRLPAQASAAGGGSRRGSATAAARPG